MMKPIIGITPDHSYETKKYMLHEDYTAAVEKAGGYPILLVPQQPLPDFVDGILLSGGGDIDPLLFREEPLTQSGEISPLRDAYEIQLCRDALEKDLPLLGICRGMQIMNIVTGGSIYQDIAVQTGSPLKHSQQAPRTYGTHTVVPEDGTLLSSLWNQKQAVVNSLHHQAVSRLGEGFLAAARSSDGLVEAIEHQDCLFALGVQWHPEAMQTEEQALLFSAFLKAAAAYRQNRR